MHTGITKSILLKFIFMKLTGGWKEKKTFSAKSEKNG